MRFELAAAMLSCVGGRYVSHSTTEVHFFSSLLHEIQTSLSEHVSSYLKMEIGHICITYIIKRDMLFLHTKLQVE